MNKNRTTLIAALSLVLCLAVSIGFTAAYFTDYESAKGGAIVKLGHQSIVEEDFDHSDKIVTVKNTGDVDIVVRLTASGDKEHMTENSTNNADWVKGTDDYWYYTKVLKAGESSSSIRIDVDGPKNPDDPIDFSIVVSHESERVTYNTDGSVVVPDGWTIGSISAE